MVNDGQYPTTALQRSMYAAAQDQRSIVVVPIGITLMGPLDKARLSDALGKLVARHEALRTRLTGGGLWQVVDEPGAVELEERTVTRDALAAACRAEFSTPIDLRGPLARFVLWQAGPEHHLLSIAADHTIIDGWSANQLMRDLADLYAGKTLRAAGASWTDYVLWETTQARTAPRTYWESALSQRATRLNRRPTVLMDEVPATVHDVATVDVAAVISRAKSYGVSVAALLAAFAIASLARHAPERFVLGVLDANRERPEFATTVGMLADVFPVPVDVSSDAELYARADRIADALQEARERRVPLSAIRDLLQPPKAGPVFDVTLNYLRRAGSTVDRVGALDISGAVSEVITPTRPTYAWHDAAALVEFRWREAGGLLAAYVVTHGPASDDPLVAEIVGELRALIRGKRCDR